MFKLKLSTKSLIMASCFGLLNVIMYLTLHKFWIGGSSFLPMIGELGKGQKFLFSFIVNVGVILGAFIGAATSGDFHFRMPKAGNLFRAVMGGFLIGVGITLGPGTCTTAFVTGAPMLSVSSFLSMAGIFIGGFIVYSLTMKKCAVR